MRDIDRAILDFANLHGGVVTKSFLDDTRLTRGQIESRVRRHGWLSLGRGSYRILEARDHRDRLAGALATIDPSVASHESAAELHGFAFVPRGVAVVSAHSRTTHVFDGVLVHRTHDIDEAHVVRVDGLRSTSVARTVVDLAAGSTDRRLGAILDDLVSRSRVTLAEVDDVLDSVARRGKPGVRRMRRVLTVRWGENRPQSILEQRARGLLRREGLPEPVSEYPIPWSVGRRFDDAYPEARLAIEWDGRRYHGQFQAFEADRMRDREALVHDWRIARFTWNDVNNHPEMVVETIRTLLRAHSVR
jgi:hypothetical protein